MAGNYGSGVNYAAEEWKQKYMELEKKYEELQNKYEALKEVYRNEITVNAYAYSPMPTTSTPSPEKKPNNYNGYSEWREGVNADFNIFQ